MTYRLPAAESAGRRSDHVGPAKAVCTPMPLIYVDFVFAVIGLLMGNI